MKQVKILTLCICTILAVPEFPSGKGWRGLTPLHSTRADVERLLGSPKESRGLAATYETKNERVNVFYSGGRCDGKSQEWDVPRDTVIRFTIHPNTPLFVDYLQLDAAHYERHTDPKLESVVYYVNKEEGIFIDARKVGENREDVDNITYGPSAMDNGLRCSRGSVRY